MAASDSIGGSPAKVLFIASNPTEMQFGFAEELHRIEEARRAYPDSYTVQARWSVSLAGLKEFVARARPDVVHVLSPTVDPVRNEIILSDASGKAEYVGVKAFAAAFARRTDVPKLVVINTCHSRPLAEALGGHVGCTISMDGVIDDHAAVDFSDAMYRALAAGKSVAEAFDLARDAVKESVPEQFDVPLLLAGRDDPNEVRIAPLAREAPAEDTGRGATSPTSERRHVKLFCSYSHKDSRYREELDTHLANLRAQGVVIWHDRLIKPGADWAREIDDNLDLADLVVLLVSADFMASQYCMGVEFERALARHDGPESIKVVAVLVRDCDLEGAPFERLQMLPTTSQGRLRPVKQWSDRDSAWTDVVVGIRNVMDLHAP